MTNPYSPPPVSLFEIDIMNRLQRDAESVASLEEIFNILYTLQDGSPLTGASAESPAYVFLPTVLDIEQVDASMPFDFPLEVQTIHRLIGQGFAILDRELHERISASDLLSSIGIEGRFTL